MRLLIIRHIYPSSMSIEQKAALITGCSEPDGLGANTALELLKHGFRVFATARNVSTMTSLEKAGCGVSVSFFASGYRLIASQLLTLDVTDGKSILAAKAEVVRLTDGRLDLLINNVSDRKVS